MASIPSNVAKLALGDASGFVPCTPLGCQRLLVESGIEISGAHVVVLGRSMIVGKPVALLLMQKAEGANATVTVVHSRSRNLPEITRSADIIIAAIGQAQFRQSRARARRRGRDRCGNQPSRRRDMRREATSLSAMSRLMKSRRKQPRLRRFPVASAR